MLKSYKIFAFISVLYLSIVSISAQCDVKSLKSKCTEQLAPGFTCIKSYPLETKKVNSKGEIEYSFVFSKGTIYMLTFSNANGEAADIEITLFDPTHKKIASNLISGKYIPLGYKCMSTGVHYITFKFMNGTDSCGLSVLGFKRG